jgi:hypothetical protein
MLSKGTASRTKAFDSIWISEIREKIQFLVKIGQGFGRMLHPGRLHHNPPKLSCGVHQPFGSLSLDE